MTASIVAGGRVLMGRRFDSLHLDELKHTSKRGGGYITNGPITKKAKIGLAVLGSRLPEADSGSDALVGPEADDAPVVQVDNYHPKRHLLRLCLSTMLTSDYNC